MRAKKPPKPCQSCSAPMEKAWGAKYCFRCFIAARHWIKRAQFAVQVARIKGDLPPARAYACVDCGRPAEVYDHRDYCEPLKVDPVCQRCNVHRGQALQLQPGAQEHIDLGALEIQQ